MRVVGIAQRVKTGAAKSLHGYRIPFCRLPQPSATGVVLLQVPGDQLCLQAPARDQAGRIRDVIQVCQFREDPKYLSAHCGAERFQRLGSDKEAFGRGVLGKDHLMVVKQQVKVFDAVYAVINVDPRQRSQLDRRGQHFDHSKHALRYSGLNQHPVLARHQQVTPWQSAAQRASQNADQVQPQGARMKFTGLQVSACNCYPSQRLYAFL